MVSHWTFQGMVNSSSFITHRVNEVSKGTLFCNVSLTLCIFFKVLYYFIDLFIMHIDVSNCISISFCIAISLWLIVYLFALLKALCWLLVRICGCKSLEFSYARRWSNTCPLVWAKCCPPISTRWQLHVHEDVHNCTNCTLAKSEDFFTSAGLLPLCKMKCPLPCVGKLI